MSGALLDLASGNRDFDVTAPRGSREVQKLWDALQVFREHDQEREQLTKKVHVLAYYDSLAALPIGRLKIDQSFVRGLIDNPDNATIVRTIISLAKNLNLHTIAEGVEDQETLDFLRDQGCDEAQGFYLSRPIPETEFVAFVLEHQRKAQDRLAAIGD